MNSYAVCVKQYEDTARICGKTNNGMKMHLLTHLCLSHRVRRTWNPPTFSYSYSYKGPMKLRVFATMEKIKTPSLEDVISEVRKCIISEGEGDIDE